jgi:hypothetical protein
MIHQIEPSRTLQSRPVPKNAKNHRTEVTVGTEDVFKSVISDLLPGFGSSRPRTLAAG